MGGICNGRSSRNKKIYLDGEIAVAVAHSAFTSTVFSQFYTLYNRLCDTFTRISKPIMAWWQAQQRCEDLCSGVIITMTITVVAILPRT
jgi:hypothetical protein